jgi:hypothetical protein
VSGQASIAGTLPVEHRLSRLRLGEVSLRLGALVVETRGAALVLSLPVGSLGEVEVTLDHESEKRLAELLAGRVDSDLFELVRAKP